MGNAMEVFDFRRIFFGDAPFLFLLEIVFRTTIMYLYAIALLRLLGKRNVGQLSTLELAIILCFGSAVGDPMIMDDVPILHGLVGITVVTLLQLLIERIINKNKKFEKAMDGVPECVVNNGIIVTKSLTADNLSQADLFRFLRIKDVKHLGEVRKAYFETSGEISVLLYEKDKIKAGLSVFPEDLDMNDEDVIDDAGNGHHSCKTCGFTTAAVSGASDSCNECGGHTWVASKL